MKLLRRIGIAIGGGTVLFIGVVMIFLPGPAIIVIPAGLAILGIEFVWARRLLRKVRELLPKDDAEREKGIKGYIHRAKKLWREFLAEMAKQLRAMRKKTETSEG